KRLPRGEPAEHPGREPRVLRRRRCRDGPPDGVGIAVPAGLAEAREVRADELLREPWHVARSHDAVEERVGDQVAEVLPQRAVAREGSVGEDERVRALEHVHRPDVEVAEDARAGLDGRDQRLAPLPHAPEAAAERLGPDGGRPGLVPVERLDRAREGVGAQEPAREAPPARGGPRPGPPPGPPPSPPAPAAPRPPPPAPP